MPSAPVPRRPFWSRLPAPRFGAAAVLLLACSAREQPTAPGPIVPPTSPSPTGPVGALTVGQSYTDRAGYVQYTPGDAPLVLVAAHGGTLAPTGLPDRTCAGCVTVTDLNTLDMARAVADSFTARTGRRPHLVVNLLHRRKLDANRDQAEATGGTRALDTTWLWFQAAIDSARARVRQQYGRGLLLDLHGHGHDVPRLELGYLLGAATLRQADSELTRTETMARSSIATVAANSRSVAERGVRLLRGPASLGDLLAARGFRAVPSSAEPAPLSGEEYFTGGYITERHGSLDGGVIDAIQIECHFNGVRDSAGSRARFAGALTDGLRVFFERHYGWSGSS